MIGTTSSINHIIQQDVNNYDHLVIWLDGTDFMNHGNDQSYTISNGNNFNQLVMQTIKNKSVSTYYKRSAAARANSIIITPTALHNYSSITMMAWCARCDNTDHNNLFTCGDASSGFFEARFRLTGTNAVGYLWASGSSYDYHSVAVGQQINEWGHMAFIRNGSSIKCYYNGIVVDQVTASTTRNSISIFHLLGDTCWTSDTGGASYCTDYRYYDIALSDADILEIYNAGPQQHRS